MFYDKYEEKIKKVADIKANILKYKLLILTIITLIVAVNITLLSVNGMIIEDLNNVSSIQYGQDLVLESNVLFKDAYYEYSDSNTNEWSIESPSVPGDYKVRLVSKRSFGFLSYGTPQLFTISPIEVDVKIESSSVVFGSNPIIAADLIEGDTITQFSVEYENPYSLNTKVTPISDSIIVMSNDIDVTSAYIFNPIQTDITITPKDITIEADSSSKIYDNTELSNDNYSISGSLLPGHTMGVEISGSITNVDTCVNEIISHNILDDNGVCITHMYNVVYIHGTLNIDKKEIEITTKDSTKIFDDIELECLEAEVNGLLDSHTFNIIGNNSITYVGSCENILEVEIISSNGIVSANYKLVYIYGTLSITKRDIDVITPDNEGIYNGEYLDILEDNIETNNVIDTHYIKVADFNKVINVSDIPEKNSVVVHVFNSNDQDMTDNYNINYIEGDLTILQREITIKTNDGNQVYDGTELIADGYNVISDTILVLNHILTVTYLNSLTYYVEGGIENKASDPIIKNSYDEDVTYNYIVNIESGTLLIEKRGINLKTLDAEKVYDGTPLTCHRYDYNGSLTLLDDITINYTGTITNVGETENIVHEDNPYSFDNDDIFNSYIINIEYGTLTITTLDVEVTTNSLTKTYNNEDFICHEFTITSTNKFLENHTLTLNYLKSIRYYTELGIENEAVFVSLLDENENDVSGNYSITIKYGTLFIDKLVVDIKTNDSSKIYDGNELVCNTNADWYYLSNVEFLDNFSINIIGTITNYKDGGTPNIVHEENPYSFDNDNIFNSYTVNISFGTLTIIQRKLSITTADTYKTYDGTYLYNANLDYDQEDSVNKSGLLNIHEITVTNFTKIIDVGIVNNTVEYIININGDTTDYSYNYEIDYNELELEITPLAIDVKSSSASKTYDNDILFNKEYSLSITNLVDSSEIVNWTEVKYYTEGTENIIEVKFYRTVEGSKVDTTSNYNITYNTKGLLVINKLEVNLITNSSSHEYDGNEYSDHGFTYALNSNELLDEITVNYTGVITNVGNTFNTVNEEDKYSFITQDIYNSYIINIEYGTLTVTKRILAIQTNSQTWTYNNEDYKCENYTITSDNKLVLDHVLTFTYENSIKYWTEKGVLNIVSNPILVDGENQSVIEHHLEENIVKFKCFNGKSEEQSNNS